MFDGELLQQTLNGRAFTASYAKKLKKFLRQIPVTPDEYKIVAIDKNFDGKFVEEWKSKRPVNGDGDGFLDLKILLREKFDCWAWGPTNYSDQLKNDLAKFGEAKILRLELPKETIQSLNKEEQNMLIAFGSASNELAYLIRLAVVSGHQKCNGKVYDAFALSQTFTVLKLYAGKISECWRLIERRFFNTKLAQKYTQLIREEERTALSKLKKYFSNGNNIVNLIRNEAAFHFSRADLFPALAAISEKKPCTTYLAGPRGYNELFDFCEIAMANHLLNQINRNPQKALRILQNDVREIGSYMLAFLGGMAFRLIVEATKRCPGKGRTISQSIPLERKKNNSSIPIFIHPPDYRQEYYKLSKALR